MADAATTGPVCRERFDEFCCTFRRGHADGDKPTKHSWAWIQAEREEEARTRALRRQMVENNALPPDVTAILNAIEKGNADAYLEAILAAAHDRKRALRSVPGFLGRRRGW